MGQAVSRRIMPRISKAVQSHESVMTQDALNDIARKRAQAAASNSKYIDPSAMDGFKRDQWKPSEMLPSEKNQKEFLKLTNNSNMSSRLGVNEEDMSQEMPQDLIQFLKDAGPLQKKVDKELTSPKVYESLLQEEDEEEQLRKLRQQQSRQRKRRMMPMISNPNDSANDAVVDESGGQEGEPFIEDGTMVSRTTNFSTQKIQEDPSSGIRLKDHEMFQLLSRAQSGNITAEAFVHERLSEDHGNNLLTEEEKQEYMGLVKNMFQYTGIPVLMQDTDKSYVGAWNDKVEDLKLSGVKLLDSDSVELYMERDSKGNHHLEVDRSKSQSKMSSRLSP